ncbi:MAG: hypothetical protein WC756_13465 [Taibaiella sp.]
MTFEIVELTEFGNRKARIYSLSEVGCEDTLFDEFLYEIKDNNEPEMNDLLNRISVIAKDTGCIDGFFDKPEGSMGEDIFALYDPIKRSLRAYCIRLGHVAIIIGGGGVKKTRTWQEDEKLSKAMNLLKKIINALDEKIGYREIKIDDYGQLTGDLTIEINT